jgi:hypothetical protein
MCSERIAKEDVSRYKICIRDMSSEVETATMLFKKAWLKNKTKQRLSGRMSA